VDLSPDKRATDADRIPPLPTLNSSVIIPYILFVSFWPLLALARFQWEAWFPYGGNPLEYFDVDKFMALQEMMQEVTIPEEGIVELPALSPAEQLVGAIFGPPPVPSSR
jgi:hypothetical protein